MKDLTFCVLGQPVPKDRPRFSGHAYTSKRTRQYEKLVRKTATEALMRWRSQYGNWPTDERYEVSMFFHRQGQIKDPRKERHPCDLDNLIKSVIDGINKLLMKDDKLIDVIYGHRYVDSERPRVVVNVKVLE